MVYIESSAPGLRQNDKSSICQWKDCLAHLIREIRSVDSGVENGHTSNKRTADEAASGEPPLKRKRGRPRKEEAEARAAAAAASGIPDSVRHV